jgi:hypothetical protein
MTLLSFRLEFYEDVVDMFYDFTTEIFGDKRKINSKYFFYRQVDKWIEDKRHIVLAVDNEDIVGFSMCYKDINNRT